MKRIISITLMIMVCFSLVGCGGDKNVYSQSKINNLKLNSIAMQNVERNGLKKEYLVDYMSDFMEQYNYAYINKTEITLTDKGKIFKDYYSEDVDGSLAYTNADYEKFFDFVSEFYELSYIEAKARVEELQYDADYNLIIDESYDEYMKDMKTAIDNLYNKYFK